MNSRNVPAVSALTLVRSVVPQAVPTVGTDPYQLVVWARGDEHAKVKQLVEELSAADSPETASRAVTYTLEEIATASAIQILQLAVPQARVSPGAETYQLLVWARPDDHKKVEETLAQIDVKGPEDKEAKAVAYKLDGSNATQSYYILVFLTQSVPTARFTMGVAPDQIIAWAQPKVHEEITELIDQIQGGEENAPKPVVYKLKNTSAAVVSLMLRQMVPGAIASPAKMPMNWLSGPAATNTRRSQNSSMNSRLRNRRKRPRCPPTTWWRRSPQPPPCPSCVPSCPRPSSRREPISTSSSPWLVPTITN